MECGMCNLVKHEATLVYHDPVIIVSLNWEPLKEPHFIVLPKRHVEQLEKLKSSELKAMFDYMAKLEHVIRLHANQETFIGMNRGKLATQSHIHFHVLPYTVGIRGFFTKAECSPYRKRLSDEELRALRDTIKKRLD